MNFGNIRSLTHAGAGNIVFRDFKEAMEGARPDQITMAADYLRSNKVECSVNFDNIRQFKMNEHLLLDWFDVSLTVNIGGLDRRSLERLNLCKVNTLKLVGEVNDRGMLRGLTDPNGPTTLILSEELQYISMRHLKHSPVTKIYAGITGEGFSDDFKWLEDSNIKFFNTGFVSASTLNKVIASGVETISAKLTTPSSFSFGSRPALKSLTIEVSEMNDDECGLLSLFDIESLHIKQQVEAHHQYCISDEGCSHLSESTISDISIKQTAPTDYTGELITSIGRGKIWRVNNR